MRVPIIFAVLLGVCACSPASPPPGSSSAEAAGATSSPPEDDTLKREKAAMAAHPGVARRDGGKLVISLNNKDQARLNNTFDDCGGSCMMWNFAGVETLQSAAGVEPYARVEAEDQLGFVSYTFVGSERGLTWFYDPPLVSPGGQYILSGNTGADPDNEPVLTLTDWSSPYPHTAYDFGAGCVPIKWLSDRQAQVQCDYPKGNDVTATVQLFGSQWRLTVDNRRIQATGKKMKYPILIAKTVPAEASEPAKLKLMGLEWLEPAPQS